MYGQVSGRAAVGMTWASAMLSRRPAAQLDAAGFRQEDLRFMRHTPEVEQTIDFRVFVGPPQSPKGYKLTCHIDLSVPAVEAIYRKMIEAVPDAAEARPMLTPIEAIKDRPLSDWVYDSEQAAADLERSVSRAVDGFILPYCESMTTIEAILARCIASIDEGLAMNELMGSSPGLKGVRPVFAAALAAHLRRKQDALAILEKAYPPDSVPRSRYASAFAYLR